VGKTKNKKQKQEGGPAHEVAARSPTSTARWTLGSCEGRKFADREEWKSVLAVLQQDGKLTVGASDVISLPVPAEE